MSLILFGLLLWWELCAGKSPYYAHSFVMWMPLKHYCLVLALFEQSPPLYCSTGCSADVTHQLYASDSQSKLLKNQSTSLQWNGSSSVPKDVDFKCFICIIYLIISGIKLVKIMSDTSWYFGCTRKIVHYITPDIPNFLYSYLKTLYCKNTECSNHRESRK